MYDPAFIQQGDLTGRTRSNHHFFASFIDLITSR